MKALLFKQSHLNEGDLKLVDLARNGDGKLIRGITDDGVEHVFYANNFKKAVKAEVITEDGDALVIPEDNHGLSPDGITLINYGGGFKVDLEGQKWGK